MRQNHNLTPERMQAYFNTVKGTDKQQRLRQMEIRIGILSVIRTDCLFTNNHACGINRSCKDCGIYKRRRSNLHTEDMD